MKVETKKSVTVIITLDRSEARWLRSLIQKNPYDTPDGEPGWERRLRRELSNQLSSREELDE